MAYEKTVWVNGQAPALDADHLNKIEQGIADADNAIPKKLNRLSDDPLAITNPTDLTTIKNNYNAYQEKYVPFTVGSSSSVGAIFFGMKTNFGGWGILIAQNGMCYCNISRDGEWNLSGGIGLNS